MIVSIKKASVPFMGMLIRKYSCKIISGICQMGLKKTSCV